MRTTPQSRRVTLVAARQRSRRRYAGRAVAARGADHPESGALDALVSVGLVAWGLAEAATMDSAVAVGLRLAFAAAATVPLAWRTRAPVAVALWACLAVVLQEGLDVLSAQAVTPYQALPLATYALVASTRRGPFPDRLAAGLCVAYPAFLLFMDRDDSFGPAHAVGVAATQATVALVGWMVRSRRLEAARAGAALHRAERDEPRQLRAALQAERETIARELGVLIAADLREIHRRLAQASHRLEAGDPASVTSECGEVQRTAARAVAEMRRLLEALRAADLPMTPRALAHAEPVAVRPGREVARTVTPALRRRAADFAVVGLLAALLIAETSAMAADRRIPALAAGIALLLAPAAVRRRWPVGAAMVIGAGFVAREFAGVLAHLPTTLMPAILVASYALGAFGAPARRVLIGAATLLASGGVVAALLIGDGGAWADLPVVAFLLACGLATGELVRQSDGLLRTVRSRGRQWAAEHVGRRRAALEEERQAVARDLHDVVAHGVSLVAIQAGAAGAIAATDREGCSRALAVATQAVGETQGQLHGLAALLGSEAADRLPGTADLPALVAAAQSAGQTVHLEICGEPGRLPAEVGLAVYRIVQESLTNARKHAPGSIAQVQLDVGPEQAQVEVVSTPGRWPAAAPGSGRGLAGMAERVQLLGGVLTASAERDGGFHVRAELPCGDR